LVKRSQYYSMTTSINPNFITFPIQETTSDLILVNDDNPNHTFFHNYPSNPYIHAIRVFGGKNYSQSYKIISLGKYPTKVKYTKKEKGIAYKIPDNYHVETTLNGLIVLCKTEYQFSRKIAVKYTIEWTDENGQKESRYSLSSAGAASSIFLNVSLTIFIIKLPLNMIFFF
jgi:hypothetical protein